MKKNSHWALWVALIVSLVAFTGCDQIQEIIGGGDDEEEGSGEESDESDESDQAGAPGDDPTPGTDPTAQNNGAPGQPGTVPTGMPGTVPGSVPGMPGGTVAGMPGGTMPTMPTGTAPGMPGGTMPTMPGGTAPGLPGGTMPTMPTGTAPGMPGGTMPAMPGTMPTMPTGTAPGMPGGTMPAMPGTMPGMPTGTAPTGQMGTPTPIPTGGNVVASRELLLGTWDADFSQELNDPNLSPEERAMAEALMGMAQMAFIFGADSTLSIQMQIMVVPIPGGTWSVVSAQGATLTINLQEPGSAPETVSIVFMSNDQIQMIDQTGEPITMNRRAM